MPCYIAIRRWTFGSQGFSLIELMVVVFLLSIVAVLIPPSLSRANSSEMKTVSRNIVSALRYTRSQAIAKQQDSLFQVNVEDRLYKYPGNPEWVRIADSLQLSFTAAASEFNDVANGSIRFYADGSSTGGRVEVFQGRKHLAIDVSWITGKVKIDDSI